MKKITFLFNAIIFSVNVFSQAPAIQWQNTIGGNSDDHLQAIQQTDDGGYILCGHSSSDSSGDKIENSNGLLDYWIVKTDSSGNIQWQNTIGGSAFDYLYSIEQTADGGYILGGYSGSDISGDKADNSNGGHDYWIIKTDAVGNIQWQNTIGGSGNDRLICILQTADGGYMLGGYSVSNISGDKTENTNGINDYWIVKTDASGIIQWQNTIGGNGGDQLNAVRQTPDGGYILGGTSDSDISGDKTENALGVDDYWLIKTDSTGNIEWQNTIGGNYSDRLYSIDLTADGGYILAGHSLSDISGDKTEDGIRDFDFWIVKTDATGNIQWQNTIGGSSSDLLFFIRQTVGGGYILSGYSDSDISGDKTENALGGDDYWLIKTDGTGTIQWQNTIGGSSSDVHSSVEQTSDGGYILGGHSSSNISGDKTEDCLGGYDYWIIKLVPDFATHINASIPDIENFILFPNPATSEIAVQSGSIKVQSIEIYNSLGEKVHAISETSGSDPEIINVSKLSSGIYFVKVFDGKKQYCKKAIIEQD